jgi:hypothetical protein
MLTDYTSSVKPEPIPIQLETWMDMSPARVGRRMVWKFSFLDGSSLTTYNTKKGMQLRARMLHI